MLKSFVLLFFRLKFALSVHQLNIKFSGTFDNLSTDSSAQVMSDFTGEGSIVH